MSTATDLKNAYDESCPICPSQKFNTPNIHQNNHLCARSGFSSGQVKTFLLYYQHLHSIHSASNSVNPRSVHETCAWNSSPTRTLAMCMQIWDTLSTLFLHISTVWCLGTGIILLPSLCRDKMQLTKRGPISWLSFVGSHYFDRECSASRYIQTWKHVKYQNNLSYLQYEESHMRFKTMVLVLTLCSLIGVISKVSNKSAPSLFKVSQFWKSRSQICDSRSQI